MQFAVLSPHLAIVIAVSPSTSRCAVRMRASVIRFAQIAQASTVNILKELESRTTSDSKGLLALPLTVSNI